MKKLLIFLLISLLAAVACHAESAKTFGKKLIEFGWDVPTADAVAKNITIMEEMPFDGIVFRLSAGTMAFDFSKPNQEAFKEDFKHCAAIQWNTFTDNFIVLFTASQQDWFDNDHWKNILERARLVAHAAKLAKCKGLCIDPEPYGTNPWSYMNAERSNERSFGDYEAIVKKRGAQFITALETEIPDISILTLFQMSGFSLPMAPLEPMRRAAVLSNHPYALLPAFLEGMLEAASPEMRIIDCNEPSYYHETAEAYLKDYHDIHQRGAFLFPSRNVEKYASHVRAGMAVYVDHCLGLRPDKTIATTLTATERLKWLKHNVYHSLATADSYVLCFSERIDWWQGKLPEGTREAISQVREKVADGRRLGFSIRKFMTAAHDRIEKGQVTSKPTVSLEVSPAAAKPVIDGKLDDDIWKTAARLQPFQLLKSNAKPKTTAWTTAWMTFDDDNLYLAIDCQEPLMDKLTMHAKEHDDENIWEGDCVEFFLALHPGNPIPCVHFIFDPFGHAWDAIHVPSARADENPECTHVTMQGANGWIIEMALPWDSLDMTVPDKGTSLRGNITRQRCTDPEQTSWAPLNNGFLEFPNFGSFIFNW